MRNLLPVLLIAGLLATGRSGAATLEEAAANPQLWPAEVSVTTLTKATLIKDGQPAGMMLVGAGKKLVVAGITTDGVTGRLGGSVVKVAVDKTDLLARLAAVGSGAAEPEQTVAPAAKPAAAHPGAGSTVHPVPAVMQRRLAGKLVRLDGSSLAPVDDTALAGVKYYGLYYSASWCGPCRAFTPGFVSAYRKLKAEHPEFEVVFISADRSSRDMRGYMRDDEMPWLALKYDEVEKNPELLRYSGPGIPCLVLVDAAGRVLADTYDGDNYLGPGQVLDQTRRLLAQGR